MNNYRTIQQKDMHKLFPHWGKNIPTLGTKCSHTGNKTALRLALSLLLMFVLGINTAWGQTDYSGTYYIGSVGYNPANTTTNFYLCPTEGWAFYVADNSVDGTDNGKPFLTTYQCRSNKYHSGNASDAVWTIEKAPAPNSDYYYIKQTNTGRYIVSNGSICNNPDRARVHLEEINNPEDLDDKALFSIYVPTGKAYLVIKPKGITDGTSAAHNNHDKHKWLCINQGNKDSLAGTDARKDGPSGFVNTGGIVCVYTEDDTNAPFYLEIPSPTISQDPSTLNVSMALDWPDVTIRYTTDGKEPTNDSTPYDGEFLPGIGTSVVKAKAFNSSGDVASATTTFELTKNAAPSISVNMSTLEATISTSVEGGTIFYTTDGKNPTASSSVYSSPISFNKPTTFKAIVGKAGYAPSTVTTKNVIKVVTPTIYDNGNVAIAITTATTGASIYYSTDGSTPTRSSSPYTAPLTNMEGKTIKAIAVKADNFDSDVATFGPVSFSCAQPIIRRTGADNFTITCSKPQSGVTIYYTTNGSTPSTSDSHVASGQAVTFDTSLLPFTVKAIAVADGFLNSSEASLTISNDGLSGSGTPADPYQIALNSDYSIFATKVNTGGEASACYIVTSNIDASGAAMITTPFTGTFDGNGYTISNLGHALFNTVSGGTVKNVILDAVGISSGTNVGSIANEAIGTSANKASIYNCGVLSGSISGSGYVGSIVGKLGESTADNCYARVINCYSYATIGGGNSVGGIVGYNSFASAANNLRTMVMNCMYYGNIAGGTNKAPIYNGENITNVGTNGLANYNYYFSGCTFTGGIDTYNCALAADERYLTRFEFYRRMLNSNGELAAWYATGSTENRSEMYKWILLPSSYGTEHPFPVLAPQGIYPSVVNFDAENAEDIDDDNEHRNEGRKLTKMGGSGTHQGQLAVTIQMGSGGNQFSAPSGAGIKSGETFPIYLNITDKDYKHFNYNYGKVQLPYYNDYCTGNYTDNRVVTGWKIVSVSGGTTSYSTGDDVVFNADGSIKSTPYNFADRKCTDKDLYSVSGRIFSQGAYWDVPDGVTSITIEPYWGKAAYLCDKYWNVVYSQDHKTAHDVTTPGVHYTNGNDYFIEGTWQKVYNSLDNAVNALSSNASHSVYDYAVVLVGNYHLVKQAASIKGGTLPFTVMSADFDKDNEPDYSFILQFTSRQNTAPIRFDFINIPGLGMAQKSYGAQSMPNVGIFKPGGWFEITNTTTVLLGQFEYDRGDKVTSPLILHGGIIEQIVSNNDGSSPLSHTQYIHMGSNVLLANFSPGIHQDRKTATKHVPVSVTGGEYEEFHLTGTYRADANISDDNAECYIHGGKFGEITGTGLEGIGHPTNHTKGNITWVIDQADITNFFGGGINAAKPSQGNIYTEITNSNVTLFCGGPKFGDMQSGKTVTTKATDCTFGTFFGAGYGGNSYNRFSPTNMTTAVNYDWNTWVNANYTCTYSGDADKNGISTEFAYEFIPMSGGMGNNVARLFVNYLSFSLATTGNVTSTLTGCKITGNFYGGGSLGKVNGDATSTLTNCTLEKNAFGAGFSATLPTVDVMNTGGFTTEPVYDPDGGVYSQGVFPGTVTYTWQHAASPSIDKDNHILYTTADLTSLGTVTGNVTLTIDGNTTLTDGKRMSVAHSVYGGGEESNVEGNTSVNITGGTISENVFGGGKGSDDNFTCDKAMVGVNNAGAGADLTTEENKNRGTKVTISNGTVNGNVYGGGEVGRVEWNTQVTIGAGEGTPIINGNVFGAGKGKETHGYAALVRGNSTVTIQGNAKVIENVYGGGEQATVGRYWVNGINNVDSEGNPIPSAPSAPTDMPDEMPYKTMSGGKCTVVVQGSAQVGPDSNVPITAGHVFGAGKGVTPNYVHTGDKANWSKRMVDYNSTKHTSEGKGTAWDYYEAYTEDQIADNTFKKYVWEYFVDDADQSAANYKSGEDKYFEFLQTLALVTGTDVTIGGSAQVKGSVFGGSESGYVQDHTDVKVTGGTIGTAELGGPYYGNVYGGGKGDAEHTGTNHNYVAAGLVKGNTKVTISNGTILHNIYGGGAYGSVGEFTYDANTGMPTGRLENTTGGNAEVIITGGTIGTNGDENGMIFGSSRGDVGAPGSIHDKLAWVYDTEVKIGTSGSGSVFTTPIIKGSVYGGGENGHNLNNADVYIYSGIVGIPSGETIGDYSGAAYPYRGNVYGGGCGTDKYDNNTKYNPKAGIVQGNAFVNMTGGFVVHNVYGAGAMGSVGTASVATSGKTTVTVSGGRIGYDGSNNGNVYGAARGDLEATDNVAQVRETAVNINYTTTPSADNEGKTVQLIAGSVFGGGEAGTVKECVAVYMTGGLVLKDVYGGGALAHTQTSNWNSTNNTWAEGKTSASNTTTVRLTGGTISGDAYGGGLGQKTGVNGATSDIPAYVYGDVLLDLNGTTSIDGNTHKPLTTGTATTNESGCVVSQIFGCNNINGSPKGDVMVHVYATQNKLTTTIAQKFIREKDCDTEREQNETDEAYVTRLKGILTGKIAFAEALNITVSQDNKDLATSQTATAANLKTAITNITTSIDAKTTTEINDARYDMVAVYGGGDMAAYNPVSPYTAQNTSGAKTQVIIEGCDETSIETVYGGGNAAAVPETNVVINAAYEIQAVFGGGNGKDNLPNGDPNPGADIGTLDHGSSIYGTGNANSVLKGGYIHEAYGGSNTKGIVKGDLNQTSDPDTGEGACELILEKVVGAGKYADIDGDVNMTLSCQPSRKVPELFAGADEANVNGNITLNITNGHFGKVFGGNNLGGAVKGKITVNVEETGCQPIRIDELYLGGNEAAYSVYGYYESDEVHPVTGKKILKPRTAEMHAITDPSAEGYKAPVTNPAADATHTFPYAQPELNIISCTSIGKVFGGGYGEGAMMYADPTVNINMVLGTPNGVTSSSIGEIGDVYGGGNAAKIIGNTTVNIGTEQTVTMITVLDDPNTTDVNENQPTVLGANITGNIYGGGNLADVTGNTFVNICAEYDNETEKFVAVAEGTSGVTIGGNVFGGGKGEAAESGDDAFLCARAMIGENGLGANPDYPNGNTSVRIGNGTVNGNVYGGGMVGRVEKNTVVTIGLEGTPTSEPEIIGNVYGGGQGEKHHGYAGLVRGNPTVTIQGNAKVRKSVYGGGEIASVARYKVAADEPEAAAHGVEVGMPYVLANANSGKCTVTIKGNAEIGPETAMKMYHSEITDGTDKPDDFGHVFGAGKGILPEVFTYADDNNRPYRIKNNGEKEYYTNEDGYFGFIRTLALSTETHVTIDGNAFVKGSVYGGSENGLVQYDTYVTINSGQIGCGKNTTERHPDAVWGDNYEVQEGTDLECAHWDYGKDTNGDQFAPYDPYAKYLYNGKYYYDEAHTKYAEGGANIATDGHTYYGNVFGGGSGSVPYFDTQQGISRYISTAGEVKGNTHVTINGGHILTNVYGGNEATNVLGTASVTMTGGTVGVPRTAEQIKNHPVTCYVFGAGKGDQRIFFNKETNVNDAIVTITGGRIYGSVFGGGEDGHVLRNTTVTIGDNGTGPTIGTTGTTYVDGNVFGGGRGFGGDALTAGNVGGAVDLIINGGEMLGSIYGGGRLASVGYGLYLTTEEGYGVMREDNQYDGSYPNPSTEAASDFYNKGRGHITITINGGTIGKEFESETEGAEHSGNVFGGSMGRLTKLDGTPFDANHWKLLATAKSATINVTGGTIKRNVYGGGEMGTVTTNTTVNVSGGTIGTTGKGADNYGNVYGGGKGLETEILAGIVKGNSNVTISDGTILHNVYGGGAYGSVGTFTISNDMRTFTWGDPYNNTGVSSVTISGGTIGEDALNGNVFGGGRGVANTFWCEKGIAYKANINISNGTVKGNVYGGGEVGRVETDTKVEIGSGTGEGPFAPNITGSVFGGGAGLETHGYSALVRGNTTVSIEGNAHVGNSVYGGGEIASVGKYGLDVNEMPSILKGGGQCTVTVQGNASIGTDVFGAGKGVSPHFDKDNADETKRSRRMIANGDNYEWDYFQNESDYLTYLTTLALATHPNVTINENATVGRSVFGGGEVGLTKGSVEVNILGGTIQEDVYGGGALADTNTTTTADLNDDGITEPVSPTTTVNLLGGTIGGDAYGGGLGQKIGFNGGTSDVEATVYGDITVNLGDENATKATKFTINYENTGEKDEANNPIMVVQSGRVFGCNNLNGSPRGDVTVNVYKTVEGNVARTTAEDPNAQEKRASRDANVSHTYELAAIYGGGNLANYSATGKKANVIIHTCDVSVQYVYGGGNAAAVPETDVLVKGAWEIDHVFGGGNGKDMYKKGNEWILNAGANVTGNTNTLLIGGYIHEAYGGSNEKGTIGGNVTINTNSERDDCACALELTKLYGAGKNADIEGDLIVVLDCAPETITEEIYGGAENANVKGNVELTITSGTFGKVFGGNNQSGSIFGHIVLNIEETSCRPIVIDKLYGCGNNAAYSVYGYKDGGTDADGYPIYIPRTSITDGDAVTFTGKHHTDPGEQGYDDPQVNIISCTRIGQVFGGGLGSGATVYGNPTVNIDQIYGKAYSDADKTQYDAVATSLGEIGDVFGGGNAANVVGNTNVNIGTRSEVWLHQSVDGDGNYTMYPANTEPGNGIPVVGANITGNVYGGGNEAEVTGDTNVNIGKKGE